MVYVIVLNWNGAADTIACAESVLALQGTPFRLVICDNASTDDSISLLRQWTHGKLTLLELPNQSTAQSTAQRAAWKHNPLPEGSVVLIQTGGNLGYAGGNNVGIRYALEQGDAEYFWVLNNDTTVSPSALTALVTKAKSNPHFGLIGSTLLYHYRPTHAQVLGGCKFNTWTTQIAPVGWGKTAEQATAADESEIEAQLDYVTGASMLVSKAFLQDVGLMQEDYFLYFEEIDWAERARRSPNHPWKLGYARDSVVLHKVGASAETGTSKAATRFFYTSKIRFMKRFYPVRTPFMLLMVLLQAVKSFLTKGATHAPVILSVLMATHRITPSTKPPRIDDNR
jgi:GT2 family glycosyltransferase